MCSITYSETSGTTIDAFALLVAPGATATAGESTTGTTSLQITGGRAGRKTYRQRELSLIIIISFITFHKG